MSPTQTSCLSKLNPLHFPHHPALQTLQKSNVRTRAAMFTCASEPAVLSVCHRSAAEPYRDTRSLPRTSSHMPVAGAAAAERWNGAVEILLRCCSGPPRLLLLTWASVFHTHTHTHWEREREERVERERERERLKKEQAQRNESRETETRGVAVRSLSLVCR